MAARPEPKILARPACAARIRSAPWLTTEEHHGKDRAESLARGRVPPARRAAAWTRARSARVPEDQSDLVDGGAAARVGLRGPAARARRRQRDAVRPHPVLTILCADGAQHSAAGYTSASVSGRGCRPSMSVKPYSCASAAATRTE